MKKTKRMNIVEWPYCLHDAHISKIEMDEDSVQFLFDDGFCAPAKEGQAWIHGYILFEKVDFDFSSISIVSIDGKDGTIEGKHYEFAEFVKEQDMIDMEVIDETYGYNKSMLKGYLHTDDSLKQFLIDIYHMGDMIYYTEG